MKNTRIILLLAAIVAARSGYAQSADTIQGPVIQTASGGLRGRTVGDITTYKGIPYAAPPVGANRWRPPQPVKPWQGIREAEKFCADCAQAGWGAAPGTIAKSSAEDCLFLNLWSPANTKKTARLPVMVWIHGGAFVFGSGSQPDFAGASFARQGIILVTINYRLGRLGFFAFPALSKSDPADFKGNYAYMDQIAALKWVRQNISLFGGDPGNVTIFGESAGGVSVHSLITIPAAKGLFQKAIIESGGGRDGVLTGRPMDRDKADPNYPVSAESIGMNFARQHHIQGVDNAALEALRALPVADIVDGGQEIDGPGGPPTYAGPILDGKLVTRTAQAAYEAGEQPAIPLIIGSNSAEVPAGFVNARSKEELLTLFNGNKQELMAAYDPDGTADFARMLTMVNTDKVWAEPARFTARAFAKQHASVYIYLFSYVSPNAQSQMRFGAAHASEIRYVFNNLRERNGADISPKDREVAETLNRYWANFARTGDPNGAGLPVWPVYDAATEQLLEITPEGMPVGKPDPKKARLDAMEHSAAKK